MIPPNERPKARLEYVGTVTDSNSEVAKAIREILVQCDDDFVPPLSIREDAAKDMGEQAFHERDIKTYFQVILKQKNLVAYCDEKIVGFMSFRCGESHDCFTPIAKSNDVVNYVSTICVLKDYRGFRIASGFYDIMETPGKLPDDVSGTCVATRTWISNDIHIGLLKKRGYFLTKTLRGDREWDGKVFDTVYYCKSMSHPDTINHRYHSSAPL